MADVPVRRLAFAIGVLAVVLAPPSLAQMETEPTCAERIYQRGSRARRALGRAYHRCARKPSPGCRYLRSADRYLERFAREVAKCTLDELDALGVIRDCRFGWAGVQVESCARLPADTPAQIGECFACWEEHLGRAMSALLLAAQATWVCDGDLSASGSCAGVACTEPLPTQYYRLFKTDEWDCQYAVSDGGHDYYRNRSRLLQACTLASDVAACLADRDHRTALRDEASTLDRVVRNGCRRTTFSPGGPLAPRHLTWWRTCPTATCESEPIERDLDAIGCIEASANALIDQLLCLESPMLGTCPASASGAFVAG
jgi:hypothetical protein